jgi:hypothetical protein
MIARLPMIALAPLDYRYALDAARTIFPPQAAPLIRCNLPELERELRQRFVAQPESIEQGALWIEPQASSWRMELNDFAYHLPLGVPLVIIVSRPLARLLPERRSWGGQALGMRLRGVYALQKDLYDAGLVIEARHGIHTAVSIALSQIGTLAARRGRPDLGDRLHFAARLRYAAQGPLAALATVGLVVARRISS